MIHLLTLYEPRKLWCRQDSTGWTMHCHTHLVLPIDPHDWASSAAVSLRISGTPHCSKNQERSRVTHLSQDLCTTINCNGSLPHHGSNHITRPWIIQTLDWNKCYSRFKNAADPWIIWTSFPAGKCIRKSRNVCNNCHFLPPLPFCHCLPSMEKSL